MPCAQASQSCFDQLGCRSCRTPDIHFMIFLSAPVVESTALETANAAPAIAKPAARPPVQTVTTAATTHAKIAPSQLRNLLAFAAFSCFLASSMDLSIFAICESCAASSWPLSDLMRWLCASALFSSVSICR